MRKITKNALIVLLIFILCTIYSYICAVDAIPTKIILFNGEKINSKILYGISLKDKKERNNSIEAATITTNFKDVKEKTIEVKLFDLFKLKEVNVNLIEKVNVIPVGAISGLKLYTNGVLIVGMSEIKGLDNKRYKPYENTAMEEGDIITRIDNVVITDTDKLVEEVNKSKGNSIKVNFLKDGKELECEINPVETDKDQYKIGLWVRDSAAGIGTLSFYEPSSGNFAALGHGITDIDTGELLDISNGEFITTKVVSIIKGKEGTPR